MPVLALAAAALLGATLAPARTATPPRPRPAAEPAVVRVRLVTSLGPITVALDTRRAPVTAANFLAYVDDGRLEGTSFYRASRRRSNPRFGFIQGGIDTDHRRALTAIPIEPTTRTGIRHVDGAISMAHGTDPNSARGNFTLGVGPNPALDARPGYPGYAAFGRVVAGMDTVRKILALPTGGGRDAMRGQMILKPVLILKAERLDGTPRPTGRVKPWLLFGR
ncbi:peptidylprolyl isomerase [Sphingomonas changnyeongensis]|uniref:peptidylprolyl isomerase n=1 Tax=Sphingomonas changnyeongensis TaxID=2698679 RepID=A0A7Z2S674_9SPHN|nr:peptidylprolyl isomerase [Sphingomonas changnyeongensis]QHL91860.1 peptidylprolyl isomerase [Sphingomonas changnyeongensis]